MEADKLERAAILARLFMLEVRAGQARFEQYCETLPRQAALERVLSEHDEFAQVFELAFQLPPLNELDQNDRKVLLADLRASMLKVKKLLAAALGPDS